MLVAAAGLSCSGVYLVPSLARAPYLLLLLLSIDDSLCHCWQTAVNVNNNAVQVVRADKSN